MWPPSWGGGLLSTASPTGEGGKESPHRGLRSESLPDVGQASVRHPLTFTESL